MRNYGVIFSGIELVAARGSVRMVSTSVHWALQHCASRLPSASSASTSGPSSRRRLQDPIPTRLPAKVRRLQDTPPSSVRILVRVVRRCEGLVDGMEEEWEGGVGTASSWTPPMSSPPCLLFLSPVPLSRSSSCCPFVRLSFLLFSSLPSCFDLLLFLALRDRRFD